jgi:PBSX family phage terminase large subunit
MAKKILQAFKFQPFSKRQNQVLSWWTEISPVKGADGIIADGAIRSGKSLCMSLSFVIWAMHTFNGQNFAMCGKSVGSFRRNVLFWLKIMLTGRGYTHEERRSENLFIVKRGKTENYFYVFGGKDERSQDFIQGITLAGVFLDEVALMPESFVNQATGRCSVDGSKMWFNCNPAYPAHWFKTDWIDRRQEKNLYYIHFTMDDNLSLSDKVKARYKALYTGVFFKRYILGLWALAEGIIYPMYEDAIEEPPDEEPLDYDISIDYGTMNAFAAILWEKHQRVDETGKVYSVWYAADEYYYSGRETGVTKTDEEYAKDLKEFVKDVIQIRENDYKGGEYYRKIKTIIDPSAASMIALLRKEGYYTVIPAVNDVMDGIRDTATAMLLGLIKISPKCKHGIAELGGYAWDSNAGEDRPVKVNDHFCDAVRYKVETQNLVLRSKHERHH